MEEDKITNMRTNANQSFPGKKGKKKSAGEKYGAKDKATKYFEIRKRNGMYNKRKTTAKLLRIRSAKVIQVLILKVCESEASFTSRSTRVYSSAR